MIARIFNKNFLVILAAIGAIELISYFTTFVPFLNSFLTVAAAIAIFVIARKNLLLALEVVMAELVIGSKGYLFAAHLGGITISVRLAIFMAILLAWLIFYARNSRIFTLVRKRAELKIFLLLSLAIVIGIIEGLIHHYPIGNIFNDVNGYFYLALLPVFIEALKSREDFSRLLQFILAGAAFVALQTLGLAYVFFHNLPIVTYFLYKWVRIAGLGEITKLSPDYYFYRIFLQSQIYLIVSASVLSAFLLAVRRNRVIFLLLCLDFSAIILSGSRSLWIGVAVMIATLIVLLAFRLKESRSKIKQSFQYLSALLASIIIGAAIVLVVVNFPAPWPNNFYAFNLIGQRLSNSEAAVSTRWNELPALIESIKKSPILGSGFGTELTFNSDDPRIKTIENPTGKVTTFSFEWGYLDTWTEMGLLGVALILILLIRLIYLGIKNLIADNDEDSRAVNLGLTLGLTAAAAIHIFSPYLNHPLGLGLLMLATTWFIIQLYQSA